jgi:hypothetical protein
MQAVPPPQPLARPIHGRELRIGERAYLVLHIDGYAHIDVLTRREPRFASAENADRPTEWVQVERYATLDLVFDDEARRRFDAWVEGELRAELSEPGKHLRTYTA